MGNSVSIWTSPPGWTYTEGDTITIGVDIPMQSLRNSQVSQVVVNVYLKNRVQHREGNVSYYNFRKESVVEHVLWRDGNAVAPDVDRARLTTHWTIPHDLPPPVTLSVFEKAYQRYQIEVTVIRPGSLSSHKKVTQVIDIKQRRPIAQLQPSFPGLVSSSTASAASRIAVGLRLENGSVVDADALLQGTLSVEPVAGEKPVNITKIGMCLEECCILGDRKFVVRREYGWQEVDVKSSSGYRWEFSLPISHRRLQSTSPGGSVSTDHYIKVVVHHNGKSPLKYQTCVTIKRYGQPPGSAVTSVHPSSASLRANISIAQPSLEQPPTSPTANELGEEATTLQPPECPDRAVSLENSATTLDVSDLNLVPHSAIKKMQSSSSTAQPPQTRRNASKDARVLTRMDDRAAALMKQGKFAEATEVSLQVLESSRKVLGPEHPDSLSRMFHLGLALHVGERLRDAEQVFRQLLPLREGVLGPSHPDTIATMDAICEELFSLGKYEESRELLEDELLRCAEAFGLDHQLTISTLINIGNAYKMQGQFQDACSVYRTALDVSERAPGKAHQTTLVRNNLQEMQKQINLHEARKQTPDSLELRQALAALHGLPIPAEPFITRSITASQLLDKCDSIVGVITAGPEVAAATALRLAETTHHPLSAPVIIPPHYTVPGPSQNHAMETASPSRSSQPFGSLVERSVAAWESIDSRGKDPRYGKQLTIERHAQVLRSVNSLDELLGLQDHQFWFFQLRESFMRQRVFQKWDPDFLEDYIILPVENKFANQMDCIFISHYWHTPAHPDPQGEDLRLLHDRLCDGLWSHVSYFWVDWTCMPQQNRTEIQQQYFKRTLKTIPTLVRDCSFTWRFPRFEPRLWVLFEVAEFTLNRSRPGPLADIEPFMKHLGEMNREGVKFVIDKHGYKCTNQSDSEQVIGWLEILLVLYKIDPNIRTRRDILNAIDSPMVGTCLHEESGIAIDKNKGIITANGKTYEFNPLPSETADNSASSAHVCIKGYYETELSDALQRAKVMDDQGEELAREYDREGEYKIAEVLHRQLLAGKEKKLGKDHVDTLVSVIFLAESLEKQGLYEEAEALYRRAEATAKQMNDLTSEIGRSLAGVVQKRKLSDLYDQWKLNPLENILGINCPDSPVNTRKHAPILGPGSKRKGAEKTHQPKRDQSVPDIVDLVILRGMVQNALGLEKQKKFKEAKETHWHVLERRKEILGLDHLDTQRSMYYLARVLRREGRKPAAERLYWLALAVSEKAPGPDHLDTLAIMSNLAATLLMQGRHTDAKEIYRQQLEREVKAFGWDHPNTFTAKFNLHDLLDENEQILVASHVNIMGNGKVTVEVRCK